jgi:hypothetical protein
MPVISEALGHTNTESTSVYLKIDIKNLRECALEIPSFCERLLKESEGNNDEE